MCHSATRTHTVMLSWWVHRAKERAFRPFFNGDVHVELNFMLPKRRFWKAEPTFQNAFSKHFSTFCSPNRVLTPLKKCFEIAFWKVGSAFQNLRLGWVNFRVTRWIFGEAVLAMELPRRYATPYSRVPAESQDEDSMLMCLSNPHCDAVMMGPPC